MQRFLELPGRHGNLAVCLHEPRKPPAPIVICCHGLTGTKIGSSYRLVTIARRLESAGIATIRFDFAGCGESEGRFEEITAQTQLDDLRTIIDFISKRREFDMSRVALVGSSFGAYTASSAAHLLPGL
ncbi:MAG TPA: alpha/beta fold hydrolase, partial [Phycisphaerae bacterium]|nr:alpha/beta fold hydrolase [Phycisphaerae bacterium]